MADRYDTHGDFSWCELLTRDVEGSKKFYKELIGWTMEDMPSQGGSYTVLKAGGKPVGGLMEMPAQIPEQAPSHWSAYITVDDIDVIAAKVTKLGGKILVPPMNLPDSRFCVFEDPQGAKLSAISYTKKPE